MFDILLGSKFSNKCKQSVKAIKCRMETIRKKKHATVRYLEKVIAVLISSGHDADAFGRMDDLISEINQAWCYDMIDKYCCCIVEHLPTMQKERVCPEETTEVVATLIFSAARFSDLPELVDLRRWFTARYGSNVGSYTNTEFLEKAQKKSFSQDKKLQLMQEIAQEYGVNWDVKLFEYTLSNSSTPSFDQSSSNETHKQFHASDGRREVPVRGNGIVNGRSAEQNSGNSVHKQQEVYSEHTNFHTTRNNTNMHLYDSTEKIGKVASRNDEAASKVPPHSTFTGDFNGSSSSQYSFAHSMNEMDQNGKGKQQKGPEIPENYYKASSLKPPYVKPSATKTPLPTGYVNSGREVEEDLKTSENSYKASNPNPPYVKPMAAKTPLATGYVQQRNHEAYYEDNLKDSRINNFGKAMASNADSYSEDGMYMDVNNQQSFIASQSERIEYDPVCGAIRHGRHTYRTFSDQPRHGMNNYKGENEPQTRSVIDHEHASAANGDSFSKNCDKSSSSQTDDAICGVIHHGRQMYRAFSDQPRNGAYSREGAGTESQTYFVSEPVGAQEQTSSSGFSANYVSKTSLSPTGAPVRKQVRSISMQPDRPGLNGRNLRRELPDYDELASRIAALRNS